MPETSTSERLAKRIAHSGLCSRRTAESWIEAGRVCVNNQVIKTPAFNVSAGDLITVDGELLKDAPAPRIWIYHKPVGLVTTHKDPGGKPTVFDNLPAGLPRVISVGRLDINSEGILLLTNDGELARTLELPANNHQRSYRVRVRGAINEKMLSAIRSGVKAGGVQYGKAKLTLDSSSGVNHWLTMTITEGKNREIRNIFAHFDCQVSRLIRISYGPYQLGDLPKGAVVEADVKKVLRRS